MEYWNNIYENFNPIAFDLGFFAVHWYGLMYVLALLSALYIAKYMVKKDAYPISNKELDDFFIWVEIGVILGARLGYILFYDENTLWYLSHPWQIFNPFYNGEFVGIRGMSYHGALIGFAIAALWFCKRRKKPFMLYMDLVAISVPLAYIFGRIGNFLNQELIGKATDVSWGIYVEGILRHPSQLYEALLEGLLVFIFIYALRQKQAFQGKLILLYGIFYGLARFIAEIWREPDPQLGYVLLESFSMGQVLSLLMITLSLVAFFMTKPNSFGMQRR